jgi:DNA-binding beta-propeller fold protein YncE
MRLHWSCSVRLHRRTCRSIQYKTGGFNAPSAAAVDAGGKVWAGNSGGNSLSVLNPCRVTGGGLAL